MLLPIFSTAQKYKVGHIYNKNGHGFAVGYQQAPPMNTGASNIAIGQRELIASPTSTSSNFEESTEVGFIDSCKNVVKRYFDFLNDNRQWGVCLAYLGFLAFIVYKRFTLA